MRRFKLQLGTHHFSIYLLEFKFTKPNFWGCLSEILLCLSVSFYFLIIVIGGEENGYCQRNRSMYNLNTNQFKNYQPILPCHPCNPKDSSQSTLLYCHFCPLIYSFLYILISYGLTGVPHHCYHFITS
jgi:hypothetical protein